MPAESRPTPGTATTRTLVSAAAVLASAGWSVFATTAWPLALTVLLLLVAAWAAYCGWWTAPACTTLTLCAAVGFVWPLLVHAPWSFRLSLLALGLALGFGCVVQIARRPPPWPSGPGLACVAAAAAMPAVALVTLASTMRGDRGSTWPTVRDALIRLFDTRRIVEDGGFDRASNHVQDPLTPEILSIFAAPGHAGLAPSELLRFEAASQGWAVLALTAWCSLILAAVIAAAVPSSRPVLRAVIAFGAGVLPWTWFIGGVVLIYGFINALVALLILASCWSVWLQGRRDPRLSGVLLILGTFAAGIAWAPAALIPWGLAMTLAWRERAHLLRMPARWTALWIAALTACLTYVVLVTWSGTGGESVRSGDLLAVDGEFMVYPAAVAGVLPLLMVIVSMRAARSSGESADRTGAMVVLASGAVAVAYLVAQRSQAGVTLWGYYPQKLAWIVSLLALVIGVRAAVVWFAGEASTRREAAAVPVIVGVMAVVAMMTASPWAARTVPTSWGGIGTYLTWTSLTDRGDDLDGSDSLNILDPVADTLFEVTAPDHRVLLSGYLDSRAVENYVNFVVLKQQQHVEHRVDLTPRQNADLRDIDELCRVLEAWGPGVEVRTSAADLEETIAETCPAAAVEVGS